MKVIHIIKKIETIDEDIKELRKLEKSLVKDKSFSTPIYISIEKQINILLGDRIKLLELKIANPPMDLLKDMDSGEGAEPEKKSKPVQKKAKPKKEKSYPDASAKRRDIEDAEDIDNIGIMTQDIIDDKFSRLKKEKELEDRKSAVESAHDKEEEDSIDDESIKLLDVALENGSLSKSSLDKERKKVRFFKDNFPGGEY